LISSVYAIFINSYHQEPEENWGFRFHHSSLQHMRIWL